MTRKRRRRVGRGHRRTGWRWGPGQVCVCACVRACVRVRECVYACVRACVWCMLCCVVLCCVCVCVCVWGTGGGIWASWVGGVAGSLSESSLTLRLKTRGTARIENKGKAHVHPFQIALVSSGPI